MPLFGVGMKGKSSNVTAQERVNFYGEPTKDGDKTRLALFGTPGTTSFVDFGDTPARGGIAIGNRMFVAHRGTFWELDNAGTKTSRGTLSTTSGRVDMHTDGEVVLILTGTNGYTFTLATNAFAVIADADFPQAAKTGGWLDGNFIVDQGDGDQFQISPDGINWDALDIASAESSPDGLVRVFPDHGEIMLAGEATTEFWGNTGAADFPFAPVRGSTLEYGLAARWSLTKFDSSVAGLFKNRMGQVQVMRLQGYTPVPMSEPELDAIINSYSTVSDATAFSYMWGGHPMYQINFPTAMKSWEFDALTGMWTQKQYGLNGARHRGEILIDFLNKPRLFDYESGKIYNVADTYTDNGDPIRSMVRSRHFFSDYNRVIVNNLFVDFETGVGVATGQGSDPRAMLRVSRDGGHSWGNELQLSLGKIGQYRTRAYSPPLGVGRDFVFELAISDPVKRVIVGAGIDYTPGAP